MRIQEVVGADQSVELVRQSALWTREASTVKSIDLLLFWAAFKDTEDKAVVRKQISRLQHLTLERVLSDELPTCDWLFWNPPAERIMLGEINTWLETVTPARRRALLFALEMEISPLDVVGLTWKQLDRSVLTPFANRLVDAQPIHIRLPYVFWEFIDEVTAAPLFRLDLSADEVAQGKGWAWFKRACRDAIKVDGDADEVDFLNQWMLMGPG